MVRQSPVPVWLAALMVVGLLVTIGSSVFFSLQRHDDLASQREHFQTITDELARRQHEADEDRARLRALVERVLVAKTGAEAQAALRDYLREQAAADKRRRESDERRDNGRSSSARPSPTPQPTPTSTHSPQPAPSRSPPPTSTPTTASPSPTPLVTCIDHTPLGRVCI